MDGHNGLSLLPDPTTDLHWSSFRGAIQDIFTKNAESHPERLCVVETVSSTVPRREFTYNDINAASNVLGHHLVTSGVERGEVVMIYAHRGVDLVVAVMGVLKAGATFSVIDPAYPPDRQIVYLDVARPRALVVIEKAAREAGELSDKVRSYIRENLHLRTEIPGLRLDVGGSLLGGILNGKDVLAPQMSLKNHSPGVLVGPDSNPTLSFTSGSEGRPKGVLGRHFSLAYYFPWMSERFHFSHHDRFTMLSGIAHDPIQRDIFTPLFLGAQLLIPAKEDIQNERLAEWMQEHGATVTHLTPAMGQILVGGASAEFPALHHAFFVGDILIKRDCRSLQRLAPNVNIVNMYGSTETQRAVSYFEIPSRAQNPTYLDTLKDVIPAGKGMLDVQLLVVNRSDRSRLCKPGEIGEIYVRAGGLSEGYLGLPDLTQTKFVMNWFLDPQKWVEEDKARTAASQSEPWRQFYLGPRDRLYKTGDLGRYTAEGDVECCGRADDQVKIRGFRIELGEIDTFLSQHPLVRENVTVVRKDHDGQPMLVSYFVPERMQWLNWLQEQGMTEENAEDSLVGLLRRYRPLRERIRDYLRGKLPAYAVPSFFIPLTRMPLNPNGKIDKPVLPFPDSVQLSAAAAGKNSESFLSMSHTERALAEIWANVIPHLDVGSIGAEDSFIDLGGHSLLAQQMIFAVKRRWGAVDLSIANVFRSPTLKGFASELDRRLGRAAAGVNGEISTVNANDVASPSASNYAADAENLVNQLPRSFPSASETGASSRSDDLTVFLTGATGFLGAFILRDLLQRQSPSLRVIAHVRAANPEAAMARVRQSCEAYGIWSPSWASRLSCVTGDLGAPRLGLSAKDYENISSTVDIVIHNGALVHWVYPYTHLKPANVDGTIEALKLCEKGKPKKFAFVSSTSVLDTEHYVKLSEDSLRLDKSGILEADNLEGSRSGLGTGYGQSKWVAEYLVKEAGSRGLKGAIVRPGYVTGESRTGGMAAEEFSRGILFRQTLTRLLVTNTDDFLIRMLKGCVQVSARPKIENSVNMVPVEHVACTVVASAFSPPVSPLGVVHVTSHPRLRFDQFLETLELHGYNVPQESYDSWRARVEKQASSSKGNSSDINVLMPLYDFVTNDLPSNTKAPELDDTNAAIALRSDAEWTGENRSAGAGVTGELMGVYLAYLVATGFLPAPKETVGKKLLPRVEISSQQLQVLGKVGGRGGSI